MVLLLIWYIAVTYNPSTFLLTFCEKSFDSLISDDVSVINQIWSHAKQNISLLFLFLLNLFVYLFVISKELVDSADSFPDVLSRFEQWLRRQELGTKYKFGVVTDG